MTSKSFAKSHVLKPVLAKQYPVVECGRGVYLYDEAGKQYLDGCSSAIVTNLGHGLQEIADTAHEQARAVSFVYRTQFTSRPLEDLASWLVARLQGMNWAFFVNSGSEATEAALRLAMQYWQEKGQPTKQKILSRRVSYHGMTLGALGVSGHYARRHRFLNILHEQPSVAPAYCYRCPFGLEPLSCGLRCAEDLEDNIRQFGADTVAAFIAEPIVGASGAALTPPDGYFQKIREICHRYDILLIVDEVLTGLGRTGTWLGIDHWQVEPDMIVLGKGMSAGYTPIAAVLASDKVIEGIRQGSGVSVFGHTYGGNPQSAAVSLAVLKYLEEHGLIEQVQAKEALLKTRLLELAERHPIIGDVRGKGFLWGLELVANRVSREPFKSDLYVAQRLVDAAFAEGLLLYPCQGMVDLTTGDAVLVAPPFIMSEGEIDDLIERLDRSLTNVEHTLAEHQNRGEMISICN